VSATGIALVWMANGVPEAGRGQTAVDLRRHAESTKPRSDVSGSR
jgi:hypothetical protein